MIPEISSQHTFSSLDGDERYTVDGVFDPKRRKFFVWFRDNPAGDSHYYGYRDFPVADGFF